MADLDREFALTTDGVTPVWIERLCKSGVSREVFYSHPPLVAVGAIETHGGGLFEPAEDGCPAVWVGCYTRAWDLADIAAFYMSRPGRWWRRLGAADLLGESNYGAFRVEPIVVHRRPLDWLRAGGDGLVLLDWSVDPVLVLCGAGALQADQQLQRRLSRRAARCAAAQVEGYFNAR